MAIEITSPDLNGPALGGFGAPDVKDPNRMGFENVLNMPDPPKKKSSFFGGFLKAIGGFAQLGGLVPGIGLPLFYGGAGASSLGNHLSSKAAAQNAATDFTPKTPTYPGFSPGASADSSLDLITSARDNAAANSVQGVK
jgi:hypothetical protein